ncbi:hypothetical protein [Ralstonia pseudosolanacearum]|uniref:hypothetical protein n=1 Tax=Ralstonia pseudosolanacearum TaxID=1310165 RepID=UPI00267623E1|nr:hypothetical protein [Ralstonia pseudosolanacearum]MDO3524737.1 hypothetical protein [Ralstonia pseudosolanacearum]MDO3554430.1 hypothetical protein [Ralstonia pseudosolanacearum]MDO3569150.1 hypothetical protein [Ralstonia pseudosolanacearum]MDO3593911.1 hypothetical protein [Ralstonia pseudosolanacearum]MDO3598935.1 hypothetical protein [Ralstonia pseudosolanacearum]
MDDFVKTYLDDSKGKPVGSLGVSESGTYTAKIDLSPAEVIEVGTQYAGKYKATMNLKNGKVFTVNDPQFSVGSLFLAMHENEACLRNLAGFMGSRKKYRYILVNSLFRYDTDFTIESTTSASVAITPAVQDLLLRKISAEFGKNTAKSIDAPNLYIGFRGLDQVPPDDAEKRAESLHQARLASQKAIEEARVATAKADAAQAARQAAEANPIANASTVAAAKAQAAVQAQTAAEAEKAEAAKDDAEKAARTAKATEVAIATSTVLPSSDREGSIAPPNSKNPQDSTVLPTPFSQTTSTSAVSAATDGATPSLVKAVDVTAVVETLTANQAVRKGAPPPTSAEPAMTLPTTDLTAPAPEVPIR